MSRDAHLFLDHVRAGLVDGTRSQIMRALVETGDVGLSRPVPVHQAAPLREHETGGIRTTRRISRELRR